MRVWKTVSISVRTVIDCRLVEPGEHVEPGEAEVRAAPKPRPVDPIAATVNDDFWDEALNDTVPSSAPVAAPAKPATKPAGNAAATIPGRPVSAAEAPPKKRKKAQGHQLGF